MRLRLSLVLLCGVAVFGLASPGHAQFVTPSSYTLSSPGEGVAQGGSFNYFDETGKQLTDGVLGGNDWSANLGNGNAFEWVAWLQAEPTITFNFASPVTLSQVQIGFNRSQGSGIFLPTNVVVNGISNALVGTEITDGARGFVNLNTTFTGTTLRVSLQDNNTSRWIFVDEVRFVSATGSASAPEPAAFTLLGIGIAAVALRRSRR